MSKYTYVIKGQVIANGFAEIEADSIAEADAKFAALEPELIRWEYDPFNLTCSATVIGVSIDEAPMQPMSWQANIAGAWGPRTCEIAANAVTKPSIASCETDAPDAVPPLQREWTMDKNEIDARLQKLRADVPSMLAEAEDEDDFWPAFAGEADVIEDGAVSAEDCRYVRNQINRILQQAGVAERF